MVAALALAGLAGAISAGAAQTTALAVQVAGPAMAVHGSDGREHVEYDLLITNAFTATVTLDSIEVHGDGKLLFALSGSSLADRTFPLSGVQPTAAIPISSTVKTLVDVVLPASFGRAWPRELTDQIRYTLPPNAPLRAAIGSTVVRGPTVPVRTEAPIIIASPVTGSGWIDANGCCGDPTAPHRNDLLAADGSYRTPELFAIDWVREINGSVFEGDGTKLTDWVSYGAPIHAVANGTVVTAINDRPEVPPNLPPGGNVTVLGPDDFPGNNVVERIAPGQYALYAHMQTGSVRVKVGEWLRTGEVIGMLGNSGNTTGPHLHFGIQDSPNILASNSLPFEIGSFTIEGTAGNGSKAGTITVSGKPRRTTQSEPLIFDVADFPG